METRNGRKPLALRFFRRCCPTATRGREQPGAARAAAFGDFRQRSSSDFRSGSAASFLQSASYFRSTRCTAPTDAMGQEQEVIRRKGSFTSSPTLFGERIKADRNWLSILVRFVNVEIDSAQGFSRCGPALPMHRGNCRCHSPIGACRISYAESHRVQLDRGTAKFHLWRRLGRSTHLDGSQPADTVF